MRMTRIGLLACGIGLALAGANAVAMQTAPAPAPAAAVAATPPPPAAATPPPPGAGLDLINERCGFCHSTAQIFSQHKTAPAWAATVQAMADRGAEVSPDEQKVIVDYLAKNYGAPATPGAAGTSPPAAP